MEFCPKCGMRLIPHHKSSKEEMSVTLVCPKCNYAKDVSAKETGASRIMELNPQEQIAVIGEQEAKIKTMPITKVECLKCGNKEAYWWMVQTRGSDESPTQFFRCTLCSYTWREIT